MNEKNINLAIDYFEQTIKQLGMPTTFRELGFTNQEDFKKVAKNCSEIFPSGTIGNFKRLTENDIVKILSNAI